MNKQLLIRVSLASSVALTAAAAMAQAEVNPFQSKHLPSGYQLAAADDKSEEGKCGEGKCGGDAASEKDAEGKCGGDAATDKDAEGKCGEGKCGST